MKWFFSLNQSSHIFDSFAEMAQVAVATARKNTSLEPVLMWDGDAEHPILDWMRGHGVLVVGRRTSLYESLVELEERTGKRGLVSIGCGTYLRLEIPFVARDLGIQDEFVLYADIDTMFLMDPVPELSVLKPKAFASALEINRAFEGDINCGVMLINLKHSEVEWPRLLEFTRRNLEAFSGKGTAWDQTAIANYYRPVTRWMYSVPLPAKAINNRVTLRLHNLLAPKWEVLPRKFNFPAWKAGAKQEGASILHFVVLKPQYLDNMPKSAVKNAALANEDFRFWCGEWRRELSEAKKDLRMLVYD